MKLNRLDHIVLTVASIDRSVAFYTRLLGMEKQVFGDQRIALVFGSQKINLHPAGREFKPHAQSPTPGSADLCFLVEEPVTELADALRQQGVDIIDGPVSRTGARQPLLSIYLRDPDGNLIELSNPAPDPDSKL